MQSECNRYLNALCKIIQWVQNADDSKLDYSRFNGSLNVITILKMDVEGEELWSVPQILETNALRNINQIHIEVNFLKIYIIHIYLYKDIF